GARLGAGQHALQGVPGVVSASGVGALRKREDVPCLREGLRPDSEMTYFVGIDPSSTCTGVCIMDENGQVLAAHAIKRDDQDGLWQRGLACDLHVALDTALSRIR